MNFNDISDREGGLLMQEAGLVYELTKNPEKLAQYCDLREQCYCEDLGIRSFSGEWDPVYDQLSDIVVVEDKRNVIGGARVFVTSGKSDILLPFESESFKLNRVLPELHLDSRYYCGISRLVVARPYRNRIIYKNLVAICSALARKRNAVFEFSVSTKVQARAHSIVFTSLGYKYDILQHIQVPYLPEYVGLNEEGIVLMATYYQEGLYTDHQSYLRHKGIRQIYRAIMGAKV